MLSNYTVHVDCRYIGTWISLVATDFSRHKNVNVDRFSTVIVRSGTR